MENKEKIESDFVQFVLRIICSKSDTGKLEQFIEDRLFGSVVIYAKKYPKNLNLRIAEEGERENGRKS